MKATTIEITTDDVIDNNLYLLNALVTEAFSTQEEEKRKKKLAMAYKTIANTLKLMGVDPQQLK